ncbi:MAG: ATP-binding protein [Verrucomicrobiota bacterium]
MTQESSDMERARLARALADRTAQLEAVTAEFDQFAQSLSHDLRAPLRALDGFARVLAEDYADKLDADGKKYVDILAAGARKASLMIDDLAALSRLCRKPFRPAAVNMVELAARKVAQLRNQGARAAFRIDALPEAWGDEDMLGTIWEQLLQNAVKFSATQAQPAIEISARTDGRQVVYCIRDNGVGFDPQYAGRLFGVFQRLHTGAEFEGRGIGLAIVRRLINRHGGKVWAEGKVNQGASFFFSLPIPEDLTAGK